MVYISTIIGGIVSNKIAKPLITNIKTGKDVTNYLSVINSYITAKLL